MGIKNHNIQLAIICISVVCIHCQISFNNLTTIGVIPGRSYNLKIRGATSSQYIVLKLLPNLDNVSECARNSVDNYKAMLRRILLPINDTLTRIKNAVKDKPMSSPGGANFWGAVIGGMALGIAAAAQVTGSIALHNSLQNAAAIHQMKDAIRHTNQAIEQLQSSTAETILAISALQDQINTQFVPALTTMSCQIVANSLGLRLNQYFSEVSLVFGPNLRDPGSETLSIQAIAKAFNGDFDTLVRMLGYTGADLMDLLESDGIQGRVIDVDLEDYYIVIQMEYPSLTVIPDATVQLFNMISYSMSGQEWISVFPTQLLVRGGFISQIDLSQCILTANSALCYHDASYPASQPILDCARGDTSTCARSRVVTSHVPRFALYNGVLFANCMPVNCRCIQPEFVINQDPGSSNVMIHSDYCNEVLIGSIYITVGPKILPRSIFSQNVSIGQEVVIDPIDIGNELAAAKLSLNQSRETIRKAKDLLDKVNPKVINMSVFGSLIFAVIALILWVFASLLWLIWLTRRINSLSGTGEQARLIVNTAPTLSTLSSYGT
uniref:Fusion glycoprotein F0 n=1 Tax=Niviventer confucianus jeilongvirus TaxID=3049975 RepID=A0A9Y1Z4E8_9MONO|nr:fusion protein [Niviventer confucianus jeilongvirus]